MLLNWSMILLIRLNKLQDLVYIYVNISCYMHFHIFFFCRLFLPMQQEFYQTLETTNHLETAKSFQIFPK